MIPRDVKNIAIIGNSKISAKGNMSLNINPKYFSTVNISINISSFKESKKGKISSVNIKYPNTSPPTNKKKINGMYESEALRSFLVNPGFINNHNWILKIGKVPTRATTAAIVI